MARRAVFVVLLIAVLAGLVGVEIFVLRAQIAAPGPSTEQTVVIVPAGAGVKAISHRLADAGILTQPWLFRLAVRWRHADKALRAGEYAFPAGVSIAGALAVLETGKTVAHWLTVPEGLTTLEVLALVNGADAMTGKAAMADAGGEGRLLPETYQYAYGDSRQALVRRMADAMDKALAKAWASRDPSVDLAGPEQALVLASLVEKETALPAERPKVAAVFLNRLAKGMRLQSDPTVVYGLSHGSGALGRALTYADLKVDTPYNTYVISGLPPTPIANPGRASLHAATHPAKTDALYFVADGTGGHVFAKTLAEHNRNVAKWRKTEHAKK